MKKRSQQIMALLLSVALLITSVPAFSSEVEAMSSEDHIALTREAAAEGMVLMENRVVNQEAGTKSLPLAQGEKVAMFGRAMIDYVRGGGGSGETNVEYTRNILQGMQVKESEGKISLVPELVNFYTQQVTTNEITDDTNIVITDEVWEAAAAATETAIVTVGRFSGETYDRTATKGDYYLSDAETQLIARVAEEFNNTIVVLNVGGVIDTSWLKGEEAIEGIDAALMAWQAGMEGGLATADILVGDVNPSGKFTDTFAKDYSDYPTSDIFFESSNHTDYEEDIYVGYRYFDTIPGASEKVNYEFGYGLSYTDFKVEVDSVNVVDKNIEVKAKVTNTGEVAGKETVQVYFGAPRGTLDKPMRELAGFAKTNFLQAGKSETLTISFPITDMSSYDDTGVIKKSAYVMEAGDYHVYVGTSITDAVNKGSRSVYNVAENIVAEQLTELGESSLLSKRMKSDGTYEKIQTTGEEANPHYTVGADGKVTVEMENYLAGTASLRVEAFDLSNEDEGWDFDVHKCLAYIYKDTYFEYEVTTEVAGRYAMIISEANGSSSAVNDCFALTVNGEDQNVTFNAPVTDTGSGAISGWYTFVECEPIYINLEQGVNIIRFTAKKQNKNYDYFRLEKAIEDISVTATGKTTIEAEDFFVVGGRTSTASTSLPARETNSGASAGALLSKMNSALGNYAQYNLDVEQAGTYRMIISASNNGTAYVMDPGVYVITEDETKAQPTTVNMPASGGYHNYAELGEFTIQLPAGKATIQLTNTNKYPNVDYFTLERIGDSADASESISATETTIIQAEKYAEADWPEANRPPFVEKFGTGSSVAHLNHKGNSVSYYLYVAEAGNYKLTLAASNGRDAFDFSPGITINGVECSKTINVPTTGNTSASGDAKWHVYQELESITVALKEGQNILTLTCAVEDKYPNIDYIKFEKAEANYERVISATSVTRVEGESCDVLGRKSSDSDGTTKPNTETSGSISILSNMSADGRYARYNMYVEEAGTYKMIFNAAHNKTQFDFDPGVRVGTWANPVTITATKTGGWYEGVDLTPIYVQLPQGNCTLQLTCLRSNYPNVDYFTLEKVEDINNVDVVSTSGTTTIQAENYDEADWPEDNNTVFAKAGSVQYMAYAGNTVSYYVNAESTGTYSLVIRGANGNAAFTLPPVYVNGVSYPSEINVPNNGWNDFGDLGPITISLQEGRNVITFKCTTNSQFPNMDYFTLTKQEETAMLSLMSLESEISAQTDKIMLMDVYNKQATMEEFLTQLSDEQLYKLLGGQPGRDGTTTSGMGNLTEFGIPTVMTTDGPQGIRLKYTTTTAWPISTCLACTWNVELVKKVGKAAALEAKENNMSIWLAPGMNIHRDPLCGRNFEYYSEDPLLTGKLAAAITEGCQNEGVAISLKHFAVNNKETNRRSCDSRVSERALREIYLRAFEIVVREADPWTIMTGYNYINGLEASESTEILTGIARNEWEYEGIFVSDWNENANHVRGILAGNDVKMPRGNELALARALESEMITREQLLSSVERLLNMIMKLDVFVNPPVIAINTTTTLKAANKIAWCDPVIQTQETSDEDGGNNLSYCNANAWTEYNIDVAASGDYTLTARCASNAGSGAFDVYVDGIKITSFDIASTGGWQKWQTFNTIDGGAISLTQGRHTLRVVFTESGSNLNWLKFELLSEGNSEPTVGTGTGSGNNESEFE